jgi:lipopolysaccharide biosynthesis glycosyltransferase
MKDQDILDYLTQRCYELVRITGGCVQIEAKANNFGRSSSSEACFVAYCSTTTPSHSPAKLTIQEAIDYHTSHYDHQAAIEELDGRAKTLENQAKALRNRIKSIKEEAAV